MVSRIFVPLLLASAVVFACGPRSHSSEPPERKRERVVDGTPILSALDVNVRDGVTFTLQLTNTSEKKLELQFPNGHTHDVVVSDASGKEVWRWSEGRMFTQALQNRVIDANETIAYTERWRPENAHGKFTAVVVLQSANYPVEQKAEFTVP
jgi:hypothetical protein